jgi:anti-sigma factor RsiW
MTTTETHHQEIWQLLPWYVNGTLEGRELDAAKAHLATCEACRDEAARCRDLAAAVQSAPAPAWTPSPAHLARLLARVDAIESPDGRAGGWRDWLQSCATALRESLWITPPAMRWALAAQGALVVVLAATAIWQAAALHGPGYRTLAGSSEQIAGKHAEVRIVFAEDITEREMRALLERAKGSIVGGPSPAGAYTVLLAADSSAAALEVLRADPKVRLAEPVRSQ